jgi:RNase P protein component
MNHLAEDRLGTAVPTPQVAFALGRSFGNAVERNRGRRRLRAAFIEALVRRDPNSRPTGAFLLTGGRGLLVDPFQQLVTSVEACFGQLDGATPSTGAGSPRTSAAR